MMDILRFINSKDIRAYLKHIGYEFNSLEAAWLIYMCRDATVNEKHKAWNELIEKMPDCKIKVRENTVPQESLHAFLKQYMELEDKYINEFRGRKHADASGDNKPFVYKFQSIDKDGRKCDCGEFSRFIVIDTDNNDISFECRKMQLNKFNSLQIAYFTPSFEFLRIDPGDIDSVKERYLFQDVFNGWWFKFPTPFKKGDIVWDMRGPESGCDGPFVIIGTCLDGFEGDNADKLKDIFIKNGDSYDMCAGGFFPDEDGRIYKECMSTYMDLEFYNGELTGSKRTLIALSNFLKGKIDIELFARAYHQIIIAGYSEKSMPCSYFKSGLILSGLSKPDHIKIWLDDVRKAPDGYCHCHSVNEAIKKIIECEEELAVIDEINCDHDLGEYASDGGDGIKLIDWLVERKTYYPVKLHTMNPVGRENMQREIDRYWNETK